MQLQLMDLIDIALTKSNYEVKFKKFDYEEMYKSLQSEYSIFHSSKDLDDFFENEVSLIDAGDDYDTSSNVSPVRELLNRNNITYTFDSLSSMFFKYDELEDTLFEQRPENGDGMIVFEHSDTYFIHSIYNILKHNGANVKVEGNTVVMDDAWEEQDFKFYFLKISGTDAMKLPLALRQHAITITDEGDYVYVEISDNSTGYYDPYYLNSLQRPIMQIVLELCKKDSWVIETNDNYISLEFKGYWSKLFNKLVNMFGNTKEVIF